MPALHPTALQALVRRRPGEASLAFPLEKLRDVAVMRLASRGSHPRLHLAHLRQQLGRGRAAAEARQLQKVRFGADQRGVASDPRAELPQSPRAPVQALAVRRIELKRGRRALPGRLVLVEPQKGLGAVGVEDHLLRALLLTLLAGEGGPGVDRSRTARPRRRRRASASASVHLERSAILAGRQLPLTTAERRGAARLRRQYARLSRLVCLPLLKGRLGSQRDISIPDDLDGNAAFDLQVLGHVAGALHRLEEPHGPRIQQDVRVSSHQSEQKQHIRRNLAQSGTA
mmetsp:Transcript_48701/g.157619  ORF Transcript_48701/g.157619 Transcript_48701/m.157619 type:complete len:286 (+) Transcript_48701:81-938(+)